MWALWTVLGIIVVGVIFVAGAIYGRTIAVKAQVEAAKLKAEASAAAKRFP